MNKQIPKNKKARKSSELKITLKYSDSPDVEDNLSKAYDVLFDEVLLRRVQKKIGKKSSKLN